MGTTGLLLLALDVATSYWAANEWLMLGSAAILFYAVFYGRPLLDEDGVHLRPIRILVLVSAAVAWLVGILLPNPTGDMLLPVNAKVIADPELASAVVLIVVYQLFYLVGLFRGGADAKAMMAITLLVPVYPNASPFPLLAIPASIQTAMQVFFPFSLSVLVDALILSLVVPIAYFLVNVARGDIGRPMWRGTRESIDHIPRHSWVMERINERGERYVVLFPSHHQDNADHVARLRQAGVTKVWVERGVPLIVLIFVGFLLSFFVGNLMLGFLTAVLPHP